MADREKVMRGLEVCSTVEDLAPCPNECPYHKPDAVCYGTARLMQDALALLKGEKAMEPVPVFVSPLNDRNYIFCGACKTMIAQDRPKNYKFCPWCGRAIKWGC